MKLSIIPVFARAVAEAVAQGRADVGIMIDGAGIGSCMVANKVPGVRAAVANNLLTARHSREHNDANVLALGAGQVGTGLAEQLVDTWLTTECTEPRHLKRVAMFGEEIASSSGDMPLTDQDIERVVTRLHDIIGPLASMEPSGESVGDNPEAAREFVRLGATGLDQRCPGGTAGRYTR